MDLLAYEDYFRTAAANHKQIGHTETEPHFFKVTPEGEEASELEDALRSKVHWPILALQDPVIRPFGDGYPNLRRMWAGSLMILTKVADKTDYSQVSQLKSECYTIAEQIRAKMVKDRKKYDMGQKSFVLPGLDINSFTIDFVPSRYTAFTGVGMTFSWNVPATGFDVNAWNNEEDYSI